MKDKDIALRSWVLKFCSLTYQDQEKIRLNLNVSELKKLDELLVQVQALGIDSQKKIIKNFIETDVKDYDSYSVLLDKVIQHISPVWCALIEDKIFSEISLQKDPSYCNEYLKYKEIFNKFKLAPKMKDSLNSYLHEKIIYEH